MIPKLDAAITSMVDELIQTRRDFHAHPELGFEEHRTAKIIASRLKDLGFEVQTGIGKTGVVGLWRGAGGGRTVGFRADMDALPVHELNDVEYRSRTDGVMHACGHDGHMAILLGFARWLAERDRPFDDNVKLLFQPAEEGGGGAVGMIEDGALANPDVEQIFGLHLWNNFEVGTLGMAPGPTMASSDAFDIKVTGKGGHGAMPHQGIDAVVVASHIVVALQTIVSRNVDPISPAVLSIGTVQAGDTGNVIAQSAFLHGTFRAFDPKLREAAPDMIRRCVTGVAQGLGAKAELIWHPQYPPTISDATSVAIARKAAESLVPDASIVTDEKTMGAEDMSFYLEKVPGCYMFVGSANKQEGLDHAHHHPKFDFDEAVLPLGVALLARCAQEFFSSEPHPGFGTNR